VSTLEVVSVRYTPINSISISLSDEKKLLTEVKSTTSLVKIVSIVMFLDCFWGRYGVIYFPQI
jgi:hypothetical protein